jgi:uncharacterized membrane protein
MAFAFPLPWWLTVIATAAVVALGILAYRRTVVPIPTASRAALIALRILSLGLLIVLLARPVVERPPSDARDAVVAIVIDTSRSMRVADASGDTRIARARQVVEDTLMPALAERTAVEVFAAGDTTAPAALDGLDASARRSDLRAALTSVRERYRGRRLAGIVLVSDGGDTGQRLEIRDQGSEIGDRRSGGDALDVPVFTVGVGSPDGIPDREILSLTAGDPRVDQASVDLRVSAVSRRLGRAPMTIRLTANGRLVDSREITPAADGAPVDAAFTVFPDAQTATVYVAAVASADDEAVVDNNERRIVISPPGRRRRVLAVSGAPGYEHTFLLRALARDPALLVDSVVRQGQNDAGQDTFLVQATPDRAPGLSRGFPASRAALFGYDAVVLANVESDRLTGADLELIAAFVGERGGGLLLMGGRSLATRGFAGSPIDAALPVDLGDRDRSTLGLPPGMDRSATPHTVILTPEGRQHPVMRLPSGGDGVVRWEDLPALAAAAPLGGPRPGASVLAVTMTPSGAVTPLVATQPFGRGRSLIFGGEAAWRWRMQRPADDRTYELFWRQAVRWLAVPSPDPITVTTTELIEAGDVLSVVVDARDQEFRAVDGVTVNATLAGPNGTVPITFRAAGRAPGRFAGAQRLDVDGVYRLHVEASRGTTRLGDADRWIVVGDSSREFADPRLHARVLERLATETGGGYEHADDAGSLVPAIQAAAPRAAAPEWEDAWHRPWVLALLAALLSAEWMLRRRWGLR